MRSDHHLVGLTDVQAYPTQEDNATINASMVQAHLCKRGLLDSLFCLRELVVIFMYQVQINAPDNISHAHTGFELTCGFLVGMVCLPWTSFTPFGQRHQDQRMHEVHTHNFSPEKMQLTLTATPQACLTTFAAMPATRAAGLLSLRLPGLGASHPVPGACLNPQSGY